MTRTARELALTKIRTHEATKVILISFKAGSTGPVSYTHLRAHET